MPAQHAITWAEALECIRENTVESLGKLGRSEAQLAHYRESMGKLKSEYASVEDIIKVRTFKFEHTLNADGRKVAITPDLATPIVVFTENEYPYWFEDGVRHWLLWCTEPLPQAKVLSIAAARLPDQELAVFVNPAALQSVLGLWHAHILARPKQAEAA